MRKTYIGELEEIILLVVAVLHQDGAYGVAITEKLIHFSDREISVSAVHATLHRLEEKGFLRSKPGEATPERGGKRKRLFTLTAAGSKAIRETRKLRDEIWDHIPSTALRPNTL